jgi:hypothetical protein
LKNGQLNYPDAYRAANSEKEGGYSIPDIRGVIGMRDRMSTAAGAAGKQGQRQCSRIGSGPRVAAHIPKPSNVLKRKRTQLMQDVRGGVAMTYSPILKLTNDTPILVNSALLVNDPDQGLIK